MAPAYTLSSDIIFSESFVARPMTTMSKPVAPGSSVPQCPAFLIWKWRRMLSTTSCEVGPAGLSTRSAPSNASNSCIGLMRRIKRPLNGVEHLPLPGVRLARNASAGSCLMAASAKLFGDFVHIHLLAFGSQANPRQLGFNFFENQGHHDRFNGANMVDQPLGIVRPCTRAGIIPFFQPEVSSLIVMGQSKFVEHVLHQSNPRKRIGLIDFI